MPLFAGAFLFTVTLTISCAANAQFLRFPADKLIFWHNYRKVIIQKSLKPAIHV